MTASLNASSRAVSDRPAADPAAASTMMLQEPSGPACAERLVLSPSCDARARDLPALRGTSPIARRCERLAQLAAADGRRPAREGRRRQLLHVHLYQLAPVAPVRPRLGARPTGITGSSRSACTRPSSRSSTTWRTSARRCARLAWSIRSRSTTTTRSGRRSRTTIGRRSTSSMPKDGSGITRSARATTSGRRASSSMLLAEAGLDDERSGLRRPWTRGDPRRRPTGTACCLRRRIWGTHGRWTSRHRAA